MPVSAFTRSTNLSCPFSSNERVISVGHPQSTTLPPSVEAGSVALAEVVVGAGAAAVGSEAVVVSPAAVGCVAAVGAEAEVAGAEVGAAAGAAQLNYRDEDEREAQKTQSVACIQRRCHRNLLFDLVGRAVSEK